MLRGFRGLISLKKVLDTLNAPVSALPGRNPSARSCTGQVATILIVMIVAMLIFILITLNIGQVSGTVLLTTNAVDAAGMTLGSQLASRSYYLYDQLDGTRQCSRGGLLGIVLAVVLAAATWYIGGAAGWAYLGAYVIAAGAIGGAIGQFIIHGTLQSALQGAFMGAVIGASFAGGQMIGFELAGGAAEGFTNYALAISAGSGAQATAAFTGAVLSTAAAAYNAAVAIDINTAAMDALAGALSRLPEYTGLRENVFLHALSLAVDDPTREPDRHDLDHDGDSAELVTAFENWYYDHTQLLVTAVSDLPARVNEFLETLFIPFYEQVRFDFLPGLDRMEIECLCEPQPMTTMEYAGSIDSIESPTLKLLRVLYSCGYEIGWLPGPSRDALIAFYCSPDDIPPPAGTDGIDGMRYEFERFIHYGRALLNEKEDECGIYYDYDPETLAKALKGGNCLDGGDWWDDLYCPASWSSSEVDDMYTVLDEVKDDLGAGIGVIKNTRGETPGCQLQWGLYEERWVTQGPPICQCAVPVSEFDNLESLCAEIFPCYWSDQAWSPCGPNEDISPWTHVIVDEGAGPEGQDEEVEVPLTWFEVCGLQVLCENPEPECLEGVHFNNPPCHVYEGGYATLLDEIAYVRDYVTNLEEHIIDLYFCGGDPCTTEEGDTRFDRSTIPPFDPDLDVSVPPTECGPEFEVCHLCPPAVIPEEPGTGALSDTEIYLTWSFSLPVADPPIVVGSVEIYRDGALATTLGGSATSFLDTGLLPETSYFYEIVPLDALGAPIGGSEVYISAATGEPGYSGAECDSSVEDITITINKIGLYGTALEPCAREGFGEGEAMLRVQFSYEVVCDCCVGVQNPELPPPEVPPEEPLPEEPSPEEPPPTIGPEEPVMETHTLSGEAWGVICIPTPDIDLNLVGLCEGLPDLPGSKEAFLEYLDRFRVFLQGDAAEIPLTDMSIRSDCDGAEGQMIFGTIDEDKEDEFSPVTATFCDTWLALTNEEGTGFLDLLPEWDADFHDPVWDAPGIPTDPRCESAQTSGLNESHGAGCIRYDWTDVRGGEQIEHRIKVTTGPFRFAWTRKTKSGNFLVNKECIVLTDYCDNMSNCSEQRNLSMGDTWLQIEREDTGTSGGPRELSSTGTVDLGLRWYTTAPTGSITRKAKIAYSYNFIGIGGIRD